MKIIRTVMWVVKIGVLTGVIAWLLTYQEPLVVEFQNYELQTSLAVAFLLGLLFIGVLWVVFTIIDRLLRLPRDVATWREDSKLQRGLSTYTQALVALASGQTESAIDLADQSTKLLGKHQHLPLFIKAQAQQQLGDRAAAASTLDQLSRSSEAAFLGLRGLLGQALQSGESARALQLTAEALKHQPQTPWLHATRMSLQAAEGNWLAVEKSIQQLYRLKAITNTRANQLYAIASLELAKRAAADDQTEQALSLAREAHRQDDTFVPAAVYYASLVRSGGRASRAASIIEKTWEQNPHPLLAQALLASWSSLKDDEQMQRAKKLLANHPEHRDALLLCAATAKQIGDVMASENYLRQLSQLDPTRGVCLQLAELCTALQKIDEARLWQTQAMTAAPDPTWICTQCHSTHDHWLAICNVCDTFGSLKWGRPSPAQYEQQSDLLIPQLPRY